MKPKTWVEISKSAFGHNVAVLKKRVGSRVKILVVVKGNAYGAGIATTVSATSALADWYGLDTLDEANQVRALCSNNILILGYVDPSDAEEVVRKQYSVLIYTDAQAHALSKYASPKNPAKVHIKVDTGLVRLGLFQGDALEYVRRVAILPNIEIEGLYTHFAKLFDSETEPMYQESLTDFHRFVRELQKLEIRPKLLHVASSFSATMFDDTQFQLVRLGISIYGLWARETDLQMISEKFPHFQLRPVLSWKTTIINLKDIPAGIGVGYGHAEVSMRTSRIAVLGAGFYDGIDRRYNKFGEVLTRGKRARIVGKIGMNMCMVDVTGIEYVSIGDEVTIIGRSGDEEITAYDIAATLDTSTYEVVTRINPLLLRVLV